MTNYTERVHQWLMLPMMRRGVLKAWYHPLERRIDYRAVSAPTP